MSTPRQLIEKLFKVESKIAVDGKKIIPFKLNEAQLELDASVTKDATRHFILKARQLGISTYIEARFLAKCLTAEGTHAVVLSQEKSATTKLLRRVHFFIDQLEKDEIKVPKEYDSKSEITFPKTNSSFYIGTAGQRGFGRGDTITDFHASEVSIWPDPNATMTAVLGALVPNGEVFLESTANGMGGYFYEQYKKCQQEDSPWKFHFYPWTMDPTYVKEPKKDFVISPDEAWLVNKHGLSMQQIVWRRDTFGGYPTLEEALQEYPITPEEAFIVSGTSYFDKSSLRAYQRLVKPPVAKGTVETTGGKGRFERGEEGPLWIWEFPKAGLEYMIACDCSEGLEDAGSDDTCIQVINRENYSQVAVLSGKIDPADTADKLFALGSYYGWPWIAVEANGPGVAVLMRLKELNYPRIYQSRQIDLDTQEEKLRWGWYTDRRTKPLLLGELRSSMKRQVLLIRDERLLGQCGTFCRQKDGGFKANSGCHDDYVISMGIAAYLHKIIPYIPQKEDTHYFQSAPQPGYDYGGTGKTGY